MDFDGSIVVPSNQDLQNWTLALPARAGIYFLWGAEHEPILLATAGSLRATVRRKLAQSSPQATTRQTKLAEITKGVSWTQANSNFVAYRQFHQLAQAIYPANYRQMLGWPDTWWVKVCLSEPFGRLLATQKISVPGPDEYIGPVPNAKAAKNFINLASDRYGLCRNYEILQQTATTTKACAYAQMGKCCGACLGKISASQYQKLLAEVLKLAEPQGRLQQHHKLEKMMKESAANLQFEQAENNKKLIKRITELEDKGFQWAGNLRRFWYLIIAPGSDRHHLWPWRVNGGTIEPGEPTKLAEIEQKIAEIVDWARQASRQPPLERPEIQKWRESISLVSYFLFRSHSDQCLYYKLDNLPNPADLAEQISDKFRASKTNKAKLEGSNQANIDLKTPVDWQE